MSDGARQAGSRRAAEVVVAGGLIATLVAGLGLLVAYLLGADTQVDGLLLAVALGGIGVSLVVWSHRLMPDPLREEERHSLASPPAVRAAVLDELLDEDAIGRRRVLSWLLLGAGGGLVAVLLVPLLSLGPRPGRSLSQTAWRRGRRLVGSDGAPVLAADVALGQVTAVYPDGAVGDADSQAVLIHVDPSEFEMDEASITAAPQGYVVYSRLCTHAGCPVGQFLDRSRHLACPCHQSTFDVLRGARPIFGPAARPLPQLPIRLEADGSFTALADFPEPVGPSFWDMPA
jgi:ubiquinol-cytochrome c reductase iron-sulfur subunit